MIPKTAGHFQQIFKRFNVIRRVKLGIFSLVWNNPYTWWNEILIKVLSSVCSLWNINRAVSDPRAQVLTAEFRKFCFSCDFSNVGSSVTSRRETSLRKARASEPNGDRMRVSKPAFDSLSSQRQSRVCPFRSPSSFIRNLWIQDTSGITFRLRDNVRVWCGTAESVDYIFQNVILLWGVNTCRFKDRCFKSSLWRMF